MRGRSKTPTKTSRRTRMPAKEKEMEEREEVIVSGLAKVGGAGSL
jgi:hypothetical protein